MPRMIFVNLPVKDLKRSVDFFTKLGFEFNPQFTDENATAMIVNDEAIAMLLVEPYFNTFHGKQTVDANKQVEVLLGFSAASREEVDKIVDVALAAGARSPRPADDRGSMYQRSFEDLDGHTWEVLWMDMSAMEQAR
jgi:uncharacterized protein